MGIKAPFSSLTSYHDDPLVCVTLIVLIIIGGVGFLVWDDVINHKFNFQKYSLHSKLVFATNFVLFVGGALLFMIFEDKKIILKDGRTAILKTPCTEDAEKLLNYIKKSCGETDFLVRYPEEWDNVTVESEEQWIESNVSSPDSLLLVCTVDGRVVGNCEITRLGGIKHRHRALIGIAILREFWGEGIGKAMFEAMLTAAHEWGVEIVELEVLDTNGRAQGLYERMGFVAVSERPRAVKLKSGDYHALLYMQKML